MDEAQREDSQPKKRMGWYPDPDDPEKERWWDGKRWTEATQSRTEKEPENPDDLPAIRNWKTSVGFSILGLVASCLAGGLLAVLFVALLSAYIGGPVSTSRLTSMAGPLVGLVIYVLGIVYISAFYLSYFKERPRITSSRAISFWNFFFGGVIFGALWNSNLTKSLNTGKSDKGVSYAVAVVLNVIAICGVGWMSFCVDMPQVEQAKSYYQQLHATYDGTRTYKEAGLTFSVPNGWEEFKLKEDSPYLFAASPLIDGGESDSVITVAVIEDTPKEGFTTMCKEEAQAIYVIKSGIAPYITNWRDETFDITKVNGYTYIVYSGYGSTESSNENEDEFYACAITHQNGNLYVFDLDEYEKSSDGKPLFLGSLKDLVSSAKYA